MGTHAPPITAEDMLNMPDDGMRHELVAGEHLVMPPVGIEHGRVAMNAGLLLGNHARATGAGVTLGEAGFLIAHDPDTVRAPDTAFVTQARADAVGRTFKYWPGAPDLAIEVVSPEDRPREVKSKAHEWVAAGATVLVLDPADRSATVYSAGDDVRAYADGDIDLSDAVPGWRPDVAGFFV